MATPDSILVGPSLRHLAVAGSVPWAGTRLGAEEQNTARVGPMWNELSPLRDALGRILDAVLRKLCQNLDEALPDHVH